MRNPLSYINDLFSGFRPAQRFSLFLLFALASGLCVYNFSYELKYGFICVAVVAFLLFVCKRLWLPKEYRRPFSTYPSLISFVLLSTAAIKQYSEIESALKSVFALFFPNGKLPDKTEEFFKAAIVVVLLIGVFVANYIFRSPWNLRSFPDLHGKQTKSGFRSNIKKVVNALKLDIENVQRTKGWTGFPFTPIEVQVEINLRNKQKKGIADLQSYIERNKRSTFFLLLGEPGTGKSISLTKLVEQLLKKATSDGIIPLYINLSEWGKPGETSLTIADKHIALQNFIRQQFNAKMALYGEANDGQLYDALYKDGRFFYVFDSFDEIPAILGATQNEAPIDELSGAISYVVRGATGNRCILASRLFRKPVDDIITRDVVLEIRPFSEKKIELALINAGIRKDVIISLFNEKSDPELAIVNPLLSLIANPFNLFLFGRYIHDHPGERNPGLFDLYDYFFRSTLQEGLSHSDYKALTADSLLAYCIKIAVHIYKERENGGLFVRVADLEIMYSEDVADAIITILEKLKLGHRSGPARELFSFAHRRLNEYLVCQTDITDKAIIDLDSIPENTRDRDLLVLYCEVAESKDALKIANFCWESIKPYTAVGLNPLHKEDYRAINCLRFLKDAFLRRPRYIDSFREELTGLLFFQMRSANISVKYIATEAAALTRKEDMEKIIIAAFRERNSAIQEAAFKTGKTTLEVSPALEVALRRYLLSIGFLAFFRQDADMRFSLKLFLSLRKLYRYYCLIRLDNYLFAIACLLAACNFRTIFVLLLLIPLHELNRIGREKLQRNNLTRSGKKIKWLNQFMTDRFNRHVASVWKIKGDFSEVDYSKNAFFTLLEKFIFSTILLSLPVSFDIRFHGIALVLLIASIVLSFPLLFGILFLRSVRISKSNVKYVLIILLYFSVYLIGLSIIPELKTSDLWDEIIAFVLFLLPLFGLICSLLIRFYRDLRLHNSVECFVSKASPNNILYYRREDIDKEFVFIHSPGLRLKYVWLLSHDGIVFKGEWPNGGPPHFEDDQASVLLMKLDLKQARLG